VASGAVANRILGRSDNASEWRPRQIAAGSHGRWQPRPRVLGTDYTWPGEPVRVLFTEQMLTLSTAVDSPEAAQAMLRHARDRQWDRVWIQGSPAFVQAACEAARALGIVAESLPTGSSTA